MELERLNRENGKPQRSSDEEISDSEDTEVGIRPKDVEERDSWGSRMEFLLAIVGFTVGIGSIWRFPIRCAQNGGGAFLIPFFFFMATCGGPLYYIEVCLGQFCGKSAGKAFEFCPLFKGILVHISGRELVILTSMYTLTFIILTMASTSFIAWHKCVLCQTETNEPLRCPYNVTVKDNVNDVVREIYESVASAIQRFNEGGILPFNVHNDLIGESNAITELLIKHRAKWHKLCKSKLNNHKYERAIATKRKSTESPDIAIETPNKVTRSNSEEAAAQVPVTCLFCNGVDGNLHQVLTFGTDKKIRDYAVRTNDTILLAKLSAGDLISKEAKYHLECLTEFYYRSENAFTATTTQNNRSQANGIALGDVISYIEDSYSQTDSDDAYPVHVLSDLGKRYNNNMRNLLIIDEPYKVNTTYLKERILTTIPYIEAHRKGKEVLLVHKDSVGDMVHTATTLDYDAEGVILTKAAKIIRRDILNRSMGGFEGSFTRQQITDSLPQSLTSLVGMVLGGQSGCSENQTQESQKVRTVSQVIMFNVSEGKNALSGKSRHPKRRETPLAIYMAMAIHAETRKRSIIDKFHALGVCISYHRLLEMSSNIGNYIIDCYEDDGIVCPPSLKTDVFTTAAVDNIDHNPTSVTAKGSFHGTGISIFQHPDNDHRGVERPRRPWVEICSTTEKYKMKELPDDYIKVPPVSGKLRTDCPDPGQRQHERHHSGISDAIAMEMRWLENVHGSLGNEVTGNSTLSWPAFHADRLSSEHAPLCSDDIGCSVLLPLFEDQAKSPAMIRHSMNIVKQTVNRLNPGQTPVIAADQPLFALARQIQWTWPNLFNEKQFVVMFGGLHVELAALKTIGDLLEDSGWTSLLIQANIATPGTADAFLKACNILRTRHAHQVTAATLFVLLKKEYEEYVDSLIYGPEMSRKLWIETRERESPMFMYWALILKLELAILHFVRSLREGNFELYIKSLSALVPWFFVLDHGNYARWLPVHIQDMIQLDTNAPDVASEFRKGHFCLQKSTRYFSSIPLDQAHEQNNRLIKDDGGAVGLTENSAQLLRWMVCGPEIARMVSEFENACDPQTNDVSNKHHEQTKATQRTFQEQVNDLKSVIEEYGNPFAEKSQDLLVLDTRDIVSTKISDSLRSMESIGRQQYESYVDERLVKRSKSVMDPIPRNKVALFSRKPVKANNKKKLEVSCLKDSVALFSRLYVSAQVRRGNLDEFFSYENTDYPPSLSRLGLPYLGTKAELLPCLEDLTGERIYECPEVNVLLVDGAALVNGMKPIKGQTFDEFAIGVFQQYVLSKCQGAHINRMDIVWDRYIECSLKECAREKRGVGIRRRVNGGTIIPCWESFLRNDDNKTELFDFLADKCKEIPVPEGKLLISSKGIDIVANTEVENVDRLSPCTHEEADTRLLLHAAHSATRESKILIKTVDTDVVVLCIAMFESIDVTELWVDFGMGKHRRYIPIHKIVATIGCDMAAAMLAFHAFTGCDQVSAFLNKGKRTAWNVLQCAPGAIEAFKTLSCMPTEEDIERCIPVLERFVVLLYDRSSGCETTNEARRDLFTTKSRSLDNIPPISAALVQHIRRTVYQAGFCWGQSLTPSLVLPSPADFGWMKEYSQTPHWQPVWSTRLPASKACLELLKCGCRKEKGCRGRCKCIKANLPCTALCSCGGVCERIN